MAETHDYPISVNLRPEGVLREIQINLLECKVCFEKFSSQQRERRPHNLSCGHVLCLECIRALSHPLLQRLECPFCRQLCDVDSTSHCRALTDLQELLLSRSPRSSVVHRAKLGSGWAGGLDSNTLHLHAAFGGWGTLVNPTGIAVFGSSGTIAVVHDGDRRVVILGSKGRKLNSFGNRGQAHEEICYPMDVAVTPSGYVVVTDVGSNALKVFTSRGSHVLTAKGSLQLPWGVDIDSSGHIIVSDLQAGNLTQVRVDYGRGVVLTSQSVVHDLQHPKAVACCRATGNIAVVEHLGDNYHPPRSLRNTRLTVFNKDFHILHQTDSWSINLASTVWLCMSSVAFDRDGNVIVIDSELGMIWSLGKLQNGPVLTPLVKEELVHPIGLISTALNMLIILDGGDHTVKMYSANSDVMDTNSHNYTYSVSDLSGLQ